MNNTPRCMAVHDISCFGRCSLTVALPIISACGVETAVLPTAVLSTHTGGFTGYTYRDLTDDIAPIGEHWKKYDLKFDAIYSGFLGSFRQIDLVAKLVDDFRQDGAFFLCDPAMADNGKMYSLFDMKFAEKMATLCAKADIIVPNFTEATFMLGEDFVEGPYTKEYVEGILKKLSDIGPSKVVLTGVYFDDVKLGSACYDRSTDSINYYLADRLTGLYHGTGDVYASALCGALLNGFTLADACKIAVDYTCGCIARTLKYSPDVRYGVNFEGEIPSLVKALGKI